MPKQDRELENDIDILMQAPQVLKLAREVVQYLPKGKTRDTVIKQVLDVRRNLINLDVLLQDIEWSFTQLRLNKQINKHIAFHDHLNDLNANTNKS